MTPEISTAPSQESQQQQRDVSDSNMGGLSPRLTKKARTEHHGMCVFVSERAYVDLLIYKKIERA